MIRLLHTADIHLDSPLKSLALRDPQLRALVQTATRSAFARIVDTALDRSVAALLIAGDLFDGAERSARTAAWLTAQLDRLRAADIRVFYIRGNHDAINPITGDLDLPANVHLFGGRGGKVELAPGVWVHGVSFTDSRAPESLLPRFPAPVAGAVNIALLHTSLAGAAGHDDYAPCSVADLTGAGFDYWALGHVHRRQIHAEAPWVVMPGMPQGRDMGEAGPKSATLLNIEDGRIGVEEVATSAVEFAELRVDAGGSDSTDTLRDALRRHLTGLADTLTSEAGIVRVTLTGTSAQTWQILRDRDTWTETAREMATDTGRLWLESLHLDLSEPTVSGQGATDELARLMTAIRAEPGFAATLRGEVERMLAELPAYRRALLAPDEGALDRLRDRLAATGAARIAALMKAAGD